MDDSTKVIIGATFAFLGAIAGSVLKGYFDRRLAKKEPKTERRAQAYEDFATYFIAGGGDGDDKNSSAKSLNLKEIIARLVVFGESDVVSEAAIFLTIYDKLDETKAKKAFSNVISAMRKSVRTGAGNKLHEKIQSLLHKYMEIK